MCGDTELPIRWLGVPENEGCLQQDRQYGAQFAESQDTCNALNADFLSCS
jgi:hypothetical protein